MPNFFQEPCPLELIHIHAHLVPVVEKLASLSSSLMMVHNTRYKMTQHRSKILL
jgi:hypothetical protein